MRIALVLVMLGAGANPPAGRWQGQMLKLHNDLRRTLQEPRLQWSEELAVLAQRWADHLLESGQLAHDPTRHGQNLFAIKGGRADVRMVFQAWAEEGSDYDYATNSCSSMCGHYTQIVWRDTTQMGCAVAQDSRREVWVCDYAQPGNVVGQRPY